MGNCLGCLEVDSDIEQHHHSGYGGGGAQGGGSCPLLTTYNVGYMAVARNLAEFEYLNELPSSLDYYVLASKDTQKYWYAKLLRAWKRANPPPTSDEAVVVLIIETVQNLYNIQGLLRFYCLPCPSAQTVQHVLKITKSKEKEFVEDDRPTWPPVLTFQDVSEVIKFEEEDEENDDKLALPLGVEYEIHTLPIMEETVGDGDGFTVFVDVNKDARETANLPLEMKVAVKMRRIALNQENFSFADDLQKQIEKGDYKVFDGEDGQAPCLLHKYRIRLRGVDAPEIGQPYGEEAKVVLRKLVKDKELLIHVYETDRFGREVGDVYCNGVFIQEVLLMEGTVWYFTKYDKREDFAKWEGKAKAARLGLWGDDNPEAPWTYRKRNRGIFRGRSYKRRGA